MGGNNLLNALLGWNELNAVVIVHFCLCSYVILVDGQFDLGLVLLGELQRCTRMRYAGVSLHILLVVL